MRLIDGFRAGLVLALTLSACARVSGEAEPAAEVAEIVCEVEGTQVRTPVVQVQADGVHLRVDNRADGERYVYKQENPTSAFNQHQAPPGLSETVSEEGPGAWKVICSPPDAYPQAGSAWVQLEVVDPDGVWRSDRPDCEHPTGIHPDYVEYFEGRLPKGERRDPLELAREAAPRELPGWQAGDVVEPAGYPAASPRKARVKRGDAVVAVLSYRSDGEGGWFFGDILYCDSPARPASPARHPRSATARNHRVEAAPASSAGR